MKAYEIAVPVVFTAAIIGLSAGVWFNPDISIDLPASIEEPVSEGQIGSLNSAHEHALFHVVINGTEKDFADQKFQLNSRYVHLENNKSAIVHKHAKGITWEMFFQTINLSTSTESDDLCLDIYGKRSCGNGSVVLNGEVNASLDREISQGDNMLIILDTKDWRAILEEYMKKQLPEYYRPQPRGRSV